MIVSHAGVFTMNDNKKIVLDNVNVKGNQLETVFISIFSI